MNLDTKITGIIQKYPQLEYDFVEKVLEIRELFNCDNQPFRLTGTKNGKKWLIDSGIDRPKICKCANCLRPKKPRPRKYKR